jgi:methyl-accepting chemotaxis protein
MVRGLFVALLAVQAVSGCFLDLFGICGGAAKIAKELDKLPAKAAAAAEQVLDELFNKDLPPFVDKITAAADEMMDRGETDYEKAVNATRDALTDLARTVVNDCEELAKDVTKDVEEIVKTVLSQTVKAVNQITKDITDSVNQIIDHLELIGKEIFCAATGYIDQFEKEFSSYFQKQDCECVQQMLASNPGLKEDCKCTSCFHIGGLYPQCPCNPWGLKFGPGWYNRGKYQFAKCHLYKPIDWDKWTVKQIENQLSIAQEMALSFRCLEDMQPGSTLNRDYFSNEFVNITHTVLVLKNTAKEAQKKQRVARRVGKHRLHALAQRLAVTGKCDDKTLPECVTQALEELETMQQQFTTTTSDLRRSMSMLSNATATNISLLSTQVNAKVSTVSSNVEILNEKVDRVGSKVEGLSVGLCSCQSHQYNEHVPAGFVLQDFSAYCSADGCKDTYNSIGTLGDDQLYICQPCLNGDGSYEALKKTKTSCTESKPQAELV